MSTLDNLSATERKQRPICTGVLDYFPDALAEVAYCSFKANEQHNPGEKMHWAKEKSIGEGNEIVRHLIDRGKKDIDGIRHSAKLAWRSLEILQREIEAEQNGLTTAQRDKLKDEVKEFKSYVQQAILRSSRRAPDHIQDTTGWSKE